MDPDEKKQEKEKVIEIFEEYFKEIENNYNINKEFITFLKKKVEKEVEDIKIYK